MTSTITEKKVYYNNLTVHHQRGNIRQINDYYPYGLTWSKPEGADAQMYQNKQWQQDEWSTSGLDMYDFHARMYDPVLGRWHAPDPMNQYDSPYTAMGNNPVTTIDPDGMLGIPWGGIISTLGNIFIPDVMVRIGGTAKGGPGPTYVSQQSPLGQAVDAIGGAVAFGLGNEILDEGKEKIASEASNAAGQQLSQQAAESTLPGDDVTASLNGGPATKSEVDKYLEDVKYYNENKPGFGDDGGDYDMSKYYTDKTLLMREITFESTFTSNEQAKDWASKEEEGIGYMNKIASAALGLATAEAGPAVGVAVALSAPDFFKVVFDVTPRAGDKLSVSYQTELHVSVMGDNYIRINLKVLHTASDGSVLTNKVTPKFKLVMGLTELDIQFMRILEQLKNVKTSLLP